MTRPSPITPNIRSRHARMRVAGRDAKQANIRRPSSKNATIQGLMGLVEDSYLVVSWTNGYQIREQTYAAIVIRPSDHLETNATEPLLPRMAAVQSMKAQQFSLTQCSLTVRHVSTMYRACPKSGLVHASAYRGYKALNCVAMVGGTGGRRTPNHAPLEQGIVVYGQTRPVQFTSQHPPNARQMPIPGAC